MLDLFQLHHCRAGGNAKREASARESSSPDLVPLVLKLLLVEARQAFHYSTRMYVN